MKQIIFLFEDDEVRRLQADVDLGTRADEIIKEAEQSLQQLLCKNKPLIQQQDGITSIARFKASQQYDYPERQNGKIMIDVRGKLIYRLGAILNRTKCDFILMRALETLTGSDATTLTELIKFYFDEFSVWDGFIQRKEKRTAAV